MADLKECTLCPRWGKTLAMLRHIEKMRASGYRVVVLSPSNTQSANAQRSHVDWVLEKWGSHGPKNER